MYQTNYGVAYLISFRPLARLPTFTYMLAMKTGDLPDRSQKTGSLGAKTVQPKTAQQWLAETRRSWRWNGGATGRHCEIELRDNLLIYRVFNHDFDYPQQTEQTQTRKAFCSDGPLAIDIEGQTYAIPESVTTAVRAYLSRPPADRC